MALDGALPVAGKRGSSALDTYPLQHMLADCADAQEKAKRYHAELAEIFRYFAPHRMPTNERAPGITGTTSEGHKRVAGDVLFDGTSLSTHASFVANMQADWMPSFEPFFKLEVSPHAIPDEGERQVVAQQYSALTDLIHALLPRVRLAALDMFADLFAGTGAMFLKKGPKHREPIQAVAVPITELALDVGATGQIERWFWQRRYKVRHIVQTWPRAREIAAIERAATSTPETLYDVVQYTYWDEAAERYRLCVWIVGESRQLIHEEVFRTCPWITPRFFVVPGESYGRGLAHLALPFVKTANKVREYQLIAAGYAALGRWTYRDDRIFNPQTANPAPGAFWKVGMTGGPMATIGRLDQPSSFEVTGFLIGDERNQIREAALDGALPDLADSVRSPTEIAARARHYDRNRGGNTVRLALEMVTPLVQRSIEIIEQHGLIAGSLDVDQIITRAVVTAPAAAAQRTRKIEATVGWMQVMAGLFGPATAMEMANIEKALPEIGMFMGVEPDHVRSPADRKALRQQVEQMLAQMRAQEAGIKPGDQAEPQQEPPAQQPAAEFMERGF